MASNRVITIKRPAQVPGFVHSIGANRLDQLQAWARTNCIDKVWWSKERRTAYFPEKAQLVEWYLCVKCQNVSITHVCAYCLKEAIKMPPQKGEIHAEDGIDQDVQQEAGLGGSSVTEEVDGQPGQTPGVD